MNHKATTRLEKLLWDLVSMKFWAWVVACYFLRIGKLESLHWTLITVGMAGIKAWDGWRLMNISTGNAGSTNG